MQPYFKTYAQQVVRNVQVLAAALVKNGCVFELAMIFLADTKRWYKLQTVGTDNHLILWDLCSLKLTGSGGEKICDLAGITINSTSCQPSPLLHANSLIADSAVYANAQAPGGTRLGTNALTSRSLIGKDMGDRRRGALASLLPFSAKMLIRYGYSSSTAPPSSRSTYRRR